MADFVGQHKTQSLPLVYLPLEGQLVHPAFHIALPGKIICSALQVFFEVLTYNAL
jgi:hypothetical protein